jgi:hypothetical protein
MESLSDLTERHLNCVNGNRPAYLAIVDEAKKQGLPFVGHVPEFVSAAEAPDLGQKSMEVTYRTLLFAARIFS